MMETTPKYYGIEKLPQSIFPITLNFKYQHQQNNLVLWITLIVENI